MPRDLFFKISEEKRNMFLQVAIEAFTTKSFEQVSVNTIIKKANISRGSFYTYFDDLEALFNYIFRFVKEERYMYAKELIKESKGDYFEFIRKLFAYDYDAYSKEGTYTLFRNYIHYIQATKKVPLQDVLLKGSFLDGDSDINQFFDLKSMNMSKEGFLDLMEIVVIIMINTFMKSENENMDKTSVLKLFNNRMNLLEYGTKKGKS
jgi:AcrR family transcriptional regulator